MSFRVLNEFAGLFAGKPYLHRDSTQGDWVAAQLFEDLLQVRSRRLRGEIDAKNRVVNNQNKRRGVLARRGDGTFGEIVPGFSPLTAPGFAVARGQVATIEIGVEVKILSKAMIKQIDRVMSDLQNQTRHFRKKGNPICVGIVGINWADHTTGYERDRSYPTDGRKDKHPVQEAAEAERRLIADAAPMFDEFVLLRYRATNVSPYSFEWKTPADSALDYAAALTRVVRLWEKRFAG